MSKSTDNILLIILAATLLLFGCSKSDDDAANDAAQVAAAGDLLQYVPADSAYVFAVLEPMPDELMDKIEPKVERILQAYQTVLRETLASYVSEAKAEGVDDAELARAEAVVKELTSLMSMQGLRDAGLEDDSRLALYGNGLLPVMRLEVSDGALFEAALARVEESAETEMERLTVANTAVRYALLDDLQLLIAVLDKQVVMALAPPGLAEAQLAMLLGFEAPARSIIESGKLQQVADEYGLQGYGLGYLDVVQLVRTATGDATGLDAELAPLAEAAAMLTDVCRDEIRGLAAIMPQVVTGYTGADAEQIETLTVFELRSDIATGLQAVPGDVPGLGGDMGGLLSFGLSLNTREMRDFMAARLDAVLEEPFECAQFADLQTGAAELRAQMQQPLPPMVFDFRGFAAVIDEIEGLDLEAQTPPTSVDGRFLLAFRDAPALVALGGMFNQEIAQLGLEPDGNPVALDIPEAQMLGGDVYAALNESALALSVGDGAQGELGAMLSAEPGTEGTFFNLSMDASRYYAFMGEAIDAEKDDAGNAMSPEFSAAMEQVMQALADMSDRTTVDMRITERGIIANSVVTLGD